MKKASSPRHSRSPRRSHSRSPRMRRSDSLGSVYSSNEGELSFLSGSEDSIGSTGSLHRHTKEKRKALTRKQKEKIKEEDQMLKILTHHTERKANKEEDRRKNESGFLSKKEYEEMQEREKRNRDWLDRSTRKEDNEENRKMHNMYERGRKYIEEGKMRKGGKRRKTRKR